MRVYLIISIISFASLNALAQQGWVEQKQLPNNGRLTRNIHFFNNQTGVAWGDNANAVASYMN